MMEVAYFNENKSCFKALSKQSSCVQKIGDRLLILSIDAAFGVAFNLDNLGEKKIQEPLRKKVNDCNDACPLVHRVPEA